MRHGRVPTLLIPLLVCGAAAAVAGWVYQVDRDKCVGCGFCVYWCPEGAISMQGPDAFIDPLLCNGCGQCVSHCPWDAIFRVWSEDIEAPAEGSAVAAGPNPSPGVLTLSGLPDGMRLSALDASGREIGCTAVEDGSASFDLSGSGSGVVFVLSEDGRLLGAFTMLRP